MRERIRKIKGELIKSTNETINESLIIILKNAWYEET